MDAPEPNDPAPADPSEPAEEAQGRPRRFQRDTSWEDLTAAVLPNGARATKFAMAADQGPPREPQLSR